MTVFEPAYLKLLATGELAQRAAQAQAMLSRCEACAWKCRVDRRAGKLGVCRVAEKARVSNYGPHMGEEDPLCGWRGSGTIFFARCNLHCQYCQNHDISQVDAGDEVTPEQLADIMLAVQRAGCHNINLVSPSHVAPQIVMAVLVAARMGLHLPLVYNSGGYDSLEMLRLLDGVVDIYMPDMKYANAQVGRHYSRVPGYPLVNQAAVCEMYRQVGDLQLDAHGLATRGLLVRHLILPNGLAGTEAVLAFVAQKISKDTYVNLMDQYRPAYQAKLYPALNRPISDAEYQAALQMAQRAGLSRLERGKPRLSL